MSIEQMDHLAGIVIGLIMVVVGAIIILKIMFDE